MGKLINTQLTVSEQSKRRKPKRKKKKNKKQRTKNKELPLCTVYSTLFSLLLEQVMTKENRIKKIGFSFSLFFYYAPYFHNFLGESKILLGVTGNTR